MKPKGRPETKNSFFLRSLKIAWNRVKKIELEKCCRQLNKLWKKVHCALSYGNFIAAFEFRSQCCIFPWSGYSKLVFLLTEPPLKISFSCFLTPRKGFRLAFGALGSDSPHEGAIDTLCKRVGIQDAIFDPLVCERYAI